MSDAGAAAAGGDGVWVMCQFLHRYLDFRIPEVESLAEMEGLGGQLAWRVPDGGVEDSPFWRLRVPSHAAAAAIARRSLLVRAMLDIWGEGETLEEMIAAVLQHPEALRAPFCAPDTTFRVLTDGFGLKHSMEEQRRIHKCMAPIPFLGKVDLKVPQHTFWVIEVGAAHPGLPPAPRRFYFGRELARGDRSALKTLDLRQRRYLGPTTMDHEMALLMCNQALARPGRLIYDPFTGTGSILLAAAFWGALTMGADIDTRVLRDGKLDAEGGRVTTWSNFDDAALQRPLALLRADLAAPPFRRGLHSWAHALVCDPPYGVRAGGRKSGRGPGEPPRAVPEEHRATHIPATAFYPLAECIADLLDAAARALVLHGRLVYFFPAALSDDRPEALPTHPCLELLASSQQLLSTKFGRRLITMRKAREWYPEAAAEAAAAAAAVAAAAAAGTLPPAAPGPDGVPSKGRHLHEGPWSKALGAAAHPQDAPRPFVARHRSKCV